MTIQTRVARSVAGRGVDQRPGRRPRVSRQTRLHMAGLLVALAVCGCSGTGASSAPTQAHGAFSPTGSMTEVRYGHTATLLSDGRVLITGGNNLNRRSMRDPAGIALAELYDPNTGQFSGTGSMTTSRVGHTATLLADGHVLIAGGYEGLTGGATAELFDPKTGKFSGTGSMTSTRRGGTATLLSDGRVLVAGGGDGSASSASAELYDPATGAFSATGSMATARMADTATLLPNGRVLIAGGRGGIALDLASAEVYDPKTGQFSATLLGDGHVLLVGNPRAAELYDPKTGRFSVSGSMPDWCVEHTATLLSDGRVLVAGGHSSSFFASAEIYQP